MFTDTIKNTDFANVLKFKILSIFYKMFKNPNATQQEA